MINADIIDNLSKEEDRLDREQENTHGDLDKMQLVFQKKIDLYKRYLKKEGLAGLDRISLQNKKEWIMSHLLSLIIEKELRDRLEDLTRRVYSLEKVVDIE